METRRPLLARGALCLLAAMLGGLRQGADAENFLRRARVNVFAVAKRLHKHRVI